MGIDLTDRKTPLPTRHYRFYMSIENSRCRDYITEKFFFNALLNNAVPIVVGPPREDYEVYVPGDAFIHVNDFESVEDMAERINFLLANDTAYFEYFNWRKRDYGNEINRDYYMSTREGLENEGFCKICKLVNEMREGNGFKFPVIEDFQKFWNGQSEDGLSNLMCDKVSELKYKSEETVEADMLTLKFNNKSRIVMDLSSISTKFPIVQKILENLEN